MADKNDDCDDSKDEVESIIDEFRRLAKENVKRKVDQVRTMRDQYGRQTFTLESSEMPVTGGVQIVLPGMEVDALEKLVQGIRTAHSLQVQVDRMRHAAMWLIEEAERIEAKDPLAFHRSDDIH